MFKMAKNIASSFVKFKFLGIGASILLPLIAILLITLITVTTILGIFSSQKSTSNYDTKSLPYEVMRYEGEVRSAMEKHGVPIEWLPILLAQIKQESGGNGNDIFQCSESKYGYIGGIESPSESIEYGVSLWKSYMDKLEARNMPVEIETILQCFNYGGGYLDWLVKNNYTGWTQENAIKFSEEKSVGLGGSYRPVNKDYPNCKYGDCLYVEHVKRWLVASSEANYTGEFIPPFRSNIRYQITAEFGHVGGPHSNAHNGTDLAGPYGCEITSASGGVVVWSGDKGDGYGSSVVVKVRDKLFIRYGHMRSGSLKVSNGQSINPGTPIGIQGDTGYSFGEHLHLEFRSNDGYDSGSLINPRDYIKL